CNFSCYSSLFLVYSRCAFHRDPTVTGVALPWHKRQRGGGAAMTFEEILDQAIAMLQRRGRLTYAALTRQFQLDDAYLEDLKAEPIERDRRAGDAAARLVLWTGGTDGPPPAAPQAPQSASPAPPLTTQAVHPPQTAPPPVERRPPEAERRQLTVLFCDLV